MLLLRQTTCPPCATTDTRKSNASSLSLTDIPSEAQVLNSVNFEETATNGTSDENAHLIYIRRFAHTTQWQDLNADGMTSQAVYCIMAINFPEKEMKFCCLN